MEKILLSNYFVALFFVIFGFSCNTDSVKTTENRPELNELLLENVDNIFTNLKKEYLPIDSMLLNDSVRLTSSLEEWAEVFGDAKMVYEIPRNTLSFTSRFNDKKATSYDFGLCLVDNYGEESQLSYLDFRNASAHIKYGAVVLSEETSLMSIDKLFPLSSKLIPITGNKLSGAITLRASSQVGDSRRVVLIFRNEKLIKLKIVNYSIFE